MSKIKIDDIYESGGIIVECMEENVENGIKQLHSALRLQESAKKEAHKQVGTPWGFKLTSLIEKSEIIKK